MFGIATSLRRPSLLTVEHNGKKVDAVAQTSKQGFVYLFDRANGTPLFPLDCRNYPPSNVPGEVGRGSSNVYLRNRRRSRDNS